MTRSRELLIADTSFVGHQRRAATKPELAVPWPDDVVRRIDAAVLAISVVTIAEERFGHRVARWGERRRAHAERWLTCDKDFLGMRDLGVVVIYLPVGHEAGVSAVR
jgi:hypothetical protein